MLYLYLYWTLGGITLIILAWTIYRLFTFRIGDFRALKIYFFYGKKGSGKSLYFAVLIKNILKEYYRIEKKFPTLPKRKLFVSNSLKLSPAFERAELGKHLAYWGSTEELYAIRNADIIWDEIGKDFPAGSWAETPKRLKQVFSHLRKRGNRLFANTQLFEDVDVSFRRQVDFAYKIDKVMGSPDFSASMPVLRKPWGVIKIREFDPMILEHVREEFNRIPLTGFPYIFFIRRRHIHFYDTTAEAAPLDTGKLYHFEQTCETCGKTHITHKHV